MGGIRKKNEGSLEKESETEDEEERERTVSLMQRRSGGSCLCSRGRFLIPNSIYALCI